MKAERPFAEYVGMTAALIVLVGSAVAVVLVCLYLTKAVICQ